MLYTENIGLRDCSGFLQIGSHIDGIDASLRVPITLCVTPIATYVCTSILRNLKPTKHMFSCYFNTISQANNFPTTLPLNTSYFYYYDLCLVNMWLIAINKIYSLRYSIIGMPTCKLNDLMTNNACYVETIQWPCLIECHIVHTHIIQTTRQINNYMTTNLQGYVNNWLD